jgi:hypothetical protein
MLLPLLVSMPEWMSVLRELSWVWLVSAIVAQMLSYVGFGMQVRALVAVAGDRLSLGRSLLLALGGSFVGTIAGGVVGSAAATTRWARSSGASARGSALAAWLPTVLDNAVLFVMALSGFAVLLARHDLARPQLIGLASAFAVLLAIGGAVMWTARHRRRVETAARHAVVRWRTWRGVSTHGIHRPRILHAFDAVATMRWMDWRGPALGTLISLGCDALTLFFLFRAAGFPMQASVMLAGYGPALLLGKAPILPGGVGIVETMMVAVYHSLGAPTATVVVVVLAYRGLSFWIPTLVGIPVTVVLRAGE